MLQHAWPAAVRSMSNTGRVKWTYHTAPDPKDNGSGGKGQRMSLWARPWSTRPTTPC
ncbi:MAG: hypothetical protein QM749_18415 [Aquabacterium sp.]